MRVNGEQVTLGTSQTVWDFLHMQGFDPARVAVERNGEILPRERFNNVVLAEKDKLEIVSFVGGG